MREFTSKYVRPWTVVILLHVKGKSLHSDDLISLNSTVSFLGMFGELCTLVLLHLINCQNAPLFPATVLCRRKGVEDEEQG